MHDDRAASSPLAFVIAGALIVGIIGVALVTTSEIATPTNTGASVSANRQAQAQGMVLIVLDTPGRASDGSEWGGTLELGSEGRLGLRHESLTYLDLVKFRNLKRAPFAADGTDMLVNYEEARQVLGLDDAGLDIHIRAYPTLTSVQDRLNQHERDPNLRVAYIGNQIETGGDVPTMGGLSCDTSPLDTDSVRYSIDITNTGTTTTQFQVRLAIDNGGKAAVIKDQSGRVAPGALTTVQLDVPYTDDTACLATTQVDTTVSDVSTSLVTRDDEIPNNVGAPGTTIAEGEPIELNAMNYLSGQDIIVGYTADENDVLDWKVLEDLTGTNVWGQGTVTVPKKGSTFTITTADLTLGALPEGTHRVVVENAGASAAQRIAVVPGTVDPYTPSGGTTTSFDPAVAIEVDYVHKLIQKFCPTYWDRSGDTSADSPLAYWGTTTAEGPQTYAEQCASYKAGLPQPGDIFWDDKALLTTEVCDRLQQGAGCSGNANLPDLSEANVLVVGSNVDHNAMTAGNFKWPLRDWVHGGGTLIAFGSPESTTNWLNPIFHVAEEGSSGGISAPDMTHPLLSVPNTLDYGSYDNRGEAWRYTGNADEHFTDIVQQGDDPITAISNPGDFGEGTILISTWLPYDPYNTGAGTGGFEGMALMDNFLTHAYRDLFLDYGPMLPSGAEVVPASGRSQICHSYDYDTWTVDEIRRCQVAEGRGLGLIDMDIALFVFSR